MQNLKKILLVGALAFSAFGYIVSVLTQGMKGPNGPMMAAIFIFALMALDGALIKGRYNLKQVNLVNLISISAFYFFSITLPLFLTCPSPLSPIVALLSFSLVTFLAFSLIAYLIRKVFGKAANW